MLVLLVAAGALAVLLWWGRRALMAPIFRKESADDFVYVEEDGSVRDLTPEERAYLNTPFDGADSGRPFIKSSYGSIAPSGARSGFMYRSMVPGHIGIRTH